MESWIGAVVFVAALVVVDLSFAWMRRRRWIYWESPSLLLMRWLRPPGEGG